MTKTPEELTADWKAGKLRDGLYYILLENQKTPTAGLETWYKNNIEDSKEYYETEQVFYEYPNNIIREILAPVPTYEEYKAIQAELAEHRHYCCCTENEVLRLKINSLEEQNAELIETNASLSSQIKHLLDLQKAEDKEVENLRELLKECKPYISYKLNQNKHIGFTPDDANLLNRINAALGESEE